MILFDSDIERILDTADMYPSITLIEGVEMVTFLLSKSLSELEELVSIKERQARLNVHYSVQGKGYWFSKNADRLFKERLVILTYLNICHERENKDNLC